MSKETRVYGEVILKVPFDVILNISEQEFERLSERQQDALIDEHIDWYEATRSGEVDEFDVYEYGEVGD